MNEIRDRVEEICRAGAAARREMAAASGQVRSQALVLMAKALRDGSAQILEENGIDLAAAQESGLSEAMCDRLRLTGERIESMAQALLHVAGLEDPIGSGSVTTRPNGLVIRRVRVPLGLVAMIYEARPNVTVDAAALCVRTGNAAVLRGGREAIHSNTVLTSLLQDALTKAGLPRTGVQLIPFTERESATALMEMRGYVDVLIPRGGKGLIRSVVEQARVPVIETGAGNCHVYVDEYADIEMALRSVENAKMQRPSVCNAAETLLCHSAVAETFLPAFRARTRGRLTLRGCERTRAILPDIESATELDYETEYNDYILAVRIVDSPEEAMAHIARYGTGHSEAIVTRSLEHAAAFQAGVDAAAVYVNASTRFTDGGEFGFGAEIGISTQKLHARGPMGLAALTTEKYLIEGNGQIR